MHEYEPRWEYDREHGAQHHQTSRPPWRWLGIGAATLVLAARSGDDAPGAIGPVTPSPTAGTSVAVVPGWIEEVQPQPDAQTVAERAVAVDTRTMKPTEEARLLIDRVDVTAQALTAEPTGDFGSRNAADHQRPPPLRPPQRNRRPPGAPWTW